MPTPSNNKNPNSIPYNKFLFFTLILISLISHTYTKNTLSNHIQSQSSNQHKQNNQSLPLKPTSTSPQSPVQNCTQAYPRLFYTQQRQIMWIKFNTLHPCNRSYVTVLQNNKITKFNCKSDIMAIQQLTVYTRYIQNCFVVIDTQLNQFNYTVYGRTGAIEQKYSIQDRMRKVRSTSMQQYGRYSIQIQILRYDQLQKQKHIKNTDTDTDTDIYRVNIPKNTKSFNMIVTADWGPMQTRTYQPIYPSLIKQIKNNINKIHGLLIIGDVAYDLSTNQCQQYQLFMNQLVSVSPYIPILPIFGNHQSSTQSNFQIFNHTFASYNLAEYDRVQAYQIWNFKLITFNPFLQIYGISSDQRYQAMSSALMNAIQKNPNNNNTNNNNNSTQFIILSSHYPLICSQMDTHCRRTLQALPQLFLDISKQKQVDLYLGAHMHQYQRIVPYIDGKFDIGNIGPYGKGQMLSIVEGVAGCDVGIIDTDYPVQNFSVAHTYNQTGYGILNVYNLMGAPYARYTHYMTPNGAETVIFDQVQINTGKRNQKVNVGDGVGGESVGASVGAEDGNKNLRLASV